jgi:hypothetical protein
MLFGHRITRQAVVLGTSVPLVMVHLVACLILGLQPLQLLACCGWIGRACAKGLICCEDGQGRVGNFAVDVDHRRDKGLALQEPLEAGKAERRFMPDQ